MGDSDDDFDSRRNRDKFRRERDDFNGNRGGGEWNDGRDRSNQFRRQYPGGPPAPSRFNRSPPQNKRFRRDWDGADQDPSIADNTFTKESLDNLTQPPLLSFKTFLLEQDDNIDQEEAVKRYSDYRNAFKKSQINEFFTAHKDEDWFKSKYHPDEYSKRIQEQKYIIEKRRKIFEKDSLNDLTLDIDNQTNLIKFLDATIIKLEGGTVDDLESPETRALHRTTSIFFRNLPMKTTKDDLENLCKQYEGFRRVCITDPAPERKFLRRAWATFDHHVQIRNICYEFSSIKLHDLDIDAIVNRDIKNRLRSINGISHHRQIARNDLRLVTKLIQQLDQQWNQQSIDLNLADYLVEQDDENTIDRDLLKVLDRLILYLRVVYSIDYYNGSEYAQEDSMPNRCGVLHVRGSPLTTTITTSELMNAIEQAENRSKILFEMHEKLNEDEAKKLGEKNEEEEIEKFIKANCEEVGKDKWSCPLSGKKFKGPEFVRKHILNKHQDKLEEVKKEVVYFNNYLYDLKRPQLPEHPSNRPGGGGTSSVPTTSGGPHPSGLPLPTPMGGPQPLLARPPLWPSMSAPVHPGPGGYYPNQYHQPRHPRAQFMYHGAPGGGPPHRPLNNRPLRSYEDLDAPNEI